MALSVVSYTNIGSGWFSATTPRSSSGIAWSTGDIIVIIGGAADANGPLGNPTNANLTIGAPKASSTSGGGLEPNIYVWASDPAASGQTAQSIQGTRSSGSPMWGHAVWVIGGNPTGITNAVANLTESSISRTVSAGSVRIYGLIDYNATNPPGKTPLAGSGTTTERLDQGDGANYAQYLYDEVGGAAGTYSYGPNNYTSLQVAQGFIELLVPGTVPSAPSGLIGSPGDTTVVLDWTDGADGGSAVTDHDVDWALASAPTSWLGPVATGSTAVTYVKTSLTNGTAYVFRVRAVNAIGDGAWSASSGEITPVAEVPLIESRLIARPMGRMG